MRGTESFCHEGGFYYPVWIEPDGEEWASHRVREACGHAGDSKEIEDYLANLFKNLELDAPSPYDCSRLVEYAARGRALCGKHFEEIKFRSRVRWVRFEEESFYRYE
jgi:hypothetical protein